MSEQAEAPGRDLFRKKQGRARDDLNAWILARKAEGYWVTLCAGNCGAWFAQLHFNGEQLSGRRAEMCGRAVCWLWQRWRKTNGRAPPAETVLGWIEKYGDRMYGAMTSANKEKRSAQPRRRAV